jgi:hypothetical protein
VAIAEGTVSNAEQGEYLRAIGTVFEILQGCSLM